MITMDSKKVSPISLLLFFLPAATPAEAATSSAAGTAPGKATASTARASTTAAARETAASTTAATAAETTSTTTSTAGEAAATAAARTAARGTACALRLGRTGRGLGLGQELLERQQLLGGNVELVALLEGGGLDALGGLDGEEDLVDGAEHLVDFADGRLVLEEDLGVEVGDFGVDGFADHFAFAGVDELAHF